MRSNKPKFNENEITLWRTLFGDVKMSPEHKRMKSSFEEGDGIRNDQMLDSIMPVRKSPNSLRKRTREASSLERAPSDDRPMTFPGALMDEDLLESKRTKRQATGLEDLL
jgi:hypothetical protein